MVLQFSGVAPSAGGHFNQWPRGETSLRNRQVHRVLGTKQWIVIPADSKLVWPSAVNKCSALSLAHHLLQG